MPSMCLPQPTCWPPCPAPSPSPRPPRRSRGGRGPRGRPPPRPPPCPPPPAAAAPPPPLPPPAVWRGRSELAPWPAGKKGDHSRMGPSIVQYVFWLNWMDAKIMNNPPIPPPYRRPPRPRPPPPLPRWPDGGSPPESYWGEGEYEGISGVNVGPSAWSGRRGPEREGWVPAE